MTVKSINCSAANGGGAFLNVLSVASWINSGMLNAYAVSKSAAWSLTDGLRQELRSQDRGSAYGLKAGAREVLADEPAHMIKRGLSVEPPIYL